MDIAGEEEEDDATDDAKGEEPEQVAEDQGPINQIVPHLDRRRRNTKMFSKQWPETVYPSRPRVTLLDDGTYECSVCTGIFDSLIAFEGHSCFGDSEEETKAGRRTRNKRKGRPVKLGEKGRLAVDRPKRRGRPSKQLKLSERPKPTSRGRGRPRGRPPRTQSPTANSGNSKVIKKKIRDPKPLHPCDHCDRAFITESKLRLHMYTHSGERPYK